MIVTKNVTLVDEAAGDGFDTERAYALQIGLDGALAFPLVLREQSWRYRRGIDERVIENGLLNTAAVLKDLLDVLRGSEP